MMRYKFVTGSVVILATTLTACSQVGKYTKIGSQNQSIEEDSTLIIPPSLKMPGDTSTQKTVSIPTSPQTKQRANPTPNKQITVARPRRGAKNYYVVVGTYPSQEEAMDTFVRLSSIGLPNSTMETRTTKAGKRLHMVRLGPFQDQAKIDKVKDSLLSDGLSQFKVVEN